MVFTMNGPASSSAQSMPKERTPSLRSTASNSSIASGASLTRRPRTRTRSRPPTGGSDTGRTSDERMLEPAPRNPNPNPARSPPSAFIVPAGMATTNVRDSFMSLQSAASSSLYPSTSTVSGTESPPSPRSMVFPDEYDVPVVDDYDGDDVSYRLRLLVNNSYFLPPAHAKPELPPAPAAPARKSSAPTLFELFRGKSRSKPTTPTSATPSAPLPGPILRTTSDQSTLGMRAPPAASQPRPSIPAAPQDRAGRVMIVHERMTDLAGAAKQAELDMKTRAVQRFPDPFDDVIDPTDAVDVPLPSARYPFAVQTSAAHGLGVQDSVGAALLADRLPPAHTDPDADWRKEILRVAVNHSMDNLNLRSDSSPASNKPSGAGRRNFGSLNSTASDSGLDSSRMFPPPLTRNRGMSSPAPRHTALDSSTTTPVTTPPRRVINPLYSLSQTDLIEGVPAPSHPAVRKSVSTPGFGQSPSAVPPVPSLPPSVRTVSSSNAASQTPVASEPTESIYSDAHDEFSRSSSRLSYFTQDSPTASTFHDAPHHFGSSLGQQQNQRSGASRRSSFDKPDTRREGQRSPPPPRPSTSISIIPLSPPPRSPLRQMSHKFLQPADPNTSDDEPGPISLNIPEPGPVDPSFPSPPLPGLRLQSPKKDADVRPALSTSPMSFFDSIQSQPNAMDDLDESDEDEDEEEVQRRLARLERERRKSESRYRAPSPLPRPGRSSADAGPREKPSLMRLRNHSTPHVSRSPSMRSTSSQSSLPFGVTDPKQPIGYAPQRSFFADKSGVAESAFDFYRYAQEHPMPDTTTLASGSDRTGSKRRPATADDANTRLRQKASVKRLDGLMIQHMEAEKERLKRIASNISGGSPRRAPP
ncbi:hypothetical protein CYLTODRAFT_486391 [Cylindrobasidium torrendii FP15055 ss-10]|uniref:Uncharacterized protein n=1 Tax=Cylindrobasidium torrendii FP15055 ss-10 TaxID=1314674 RepID=A0A0D7BP90_9AGAR|nr:hypothetical protein CYLTODRAFT_486391 [Cylindrobasidium torrendii FP15055 ss-10]